MQRRCRVAVLSFLSLAAFLCLDLPAEVRPRPALADESSSGTVRPLTIEQCIEAALRNNVDIAVSAARKEAGEAGVTIEEAVFLPRFTVEAGHTRSVQPNDSSLAETPALDRRLYRLDLGGTKLTRSGTSLSLKFENQRQDLASAEQRLSPQYTSGLTLSAVQPLLKNKGRAVTGAALEVARADARIREEEWRTKVMDVVASARTAFLSFHAAASEVEVRRSAVHLAEQVLLQVDARIEKEVAAPMDRLPAEAARAARMEELIRAEGAAQNAADDLRNVLGIRARSQGWEERYVPEAPSSEVRPADERDSFEEAMRRRPETAAQASRMAQADLQEMVAKNRLRPVLDLTLSSGLSGLAGTPNPQAFRFFSTSSSPFQGDLGKSLDQMLSARYYNWFVGVKTELPWRADRERAEYLRAQKGVQEQRLQEEGLASRIRAEVSKARRDLSSALARIRAAGVSTGAAAKKLEAEQHKLELGRSTLFQVLQYQQDLSEAKLAELKARIDAWVAQTNLWRATGTILENSGIEEAGTR